MKIVASFAVAVITMCSPLSAVQPNSEPLQRLWTIWKVQQNEIVTAKIEYRSARRAIPAGVSIDPAKFRSLVNWQALVADPGELDRLVRALDQTLSPKSPAWILKTLIIDEKRRRESFDFQGRQWITVQTAEADIRTSADPGQLHVYASGGLSTSTTRLSLLRLVPEFSRKTELKVVAADRGSLITIAADPGAIHILADSTTGFVHEFSKWTHGGQMRLVLQYGQTKHSDGITFPACHVEGVFANGQLRDFAVSVVTNARFNQPIEIDAFDVEAPAGTRVLDQREDRTRPKFIVLDKPTANVLDAIARVKPEDIRQLP